MSVPASASIPLREYPVTLGVLALVLGPLVTVHMVMTAFLYVKVDRMQEEFSLLRAGQSKLEGRFEKVEYRSERVEDALHQLVQRQERVETVLQQQTALLQQLAKP